MANGAIFNTPNIFLQGSQLYQNANSRIFDAITQAADIYEKMQMTRDANLNALRMKQAELNADPERASLPILAKARQFGVASLSPEEKAMFDASQQILASKVAIQPATGQAYSPYTAISLDNKAPPSAAAEMFTNAGILPPPREAAPAPLGEPKLKSEFEGSSVDDTGIGNTPVGRMEKFKSNLETDRQIKVEDAKQKFDQRKAEFYKPKLQAVLEKMSDINEQLQKSSALKSEDKSGLSNALNTLAGTDIPIPFSGKSIPVGRATEEVARKKVASLRDQYDSLKSNAMSLLKNAANIAAGSMNSDAEQRLALSSFGDPNGNYEANKKALEATMESYGTRAARAAAEKGAPKDEAKWPEAKIQKALKAGYSMDEIKAYMNGRRK